MKNTLFALCAFLLAASCGENGTAPTPINPAFAGVEQLFRVPTPTSYPFHQPSVDAERIYADLDAGPLVALHRATGQEVWRYVRPIGGPSSVSVYAGRVLFVGSLAIALDAATGQELWRFDPGEQGALGVSSAHAGGFYFGTDHVIFGVSVTDGSLLWRTDVGPDWQHRGIVRGVSVGGDTVYANVEQYLTQNGHLAVGRIFALDRRTGQILWTHTEGNGSDRHWFRNEPVVAGNYILLSDHEANVYVALDRMTGQVRWRTPGDPDRYFGALDVPKVSGDTVYAASADRWVTAMELSTGRVLWATRLMGSVDAITLCGSRILAHDGILHVLERSTGKLLKSVIEDNSTYSTLMTSKFATDERHSYVFGNRFAYGFRCPE